MAQCPASPKRGGATLEDLQSSCGRTEDEGDSLEATADQAALAYTLSSSALEFPADAEAGEKPSLYAALDALRVTPKPLEKTPPPNPGAPVSSPAPEAGSAPRPPSRQPHVQPRAAASSRGLSGPRVVLLTCAAATLLAFTAAVVAVAIVITKSSDELSRSMDEVRRVLQVNIATTRVTALSPTATRDRRQESGTASPSGEARSALRNWLNTTGASS